MEKVTLEASNLYDAVELNVHNKEDIAEGDRSKRRRNNMNHLDTRQYLYCLTPKKVRRKSRGGVCNVGPHV